MAFYRLEKLINLSNGFRRVYQLPEATLLLIYQDDTAFLLENLCPHLQTPLAHGSINGGIIRCPGHGIEFDLYSGRVQKNPPPCNPLRIFSIQYDGDYLAVDL